MTPFDKIILYDLTFSSRLTLALFCTVFDIWFRKNCDREIRVGSVTDIETGKPFDGLVCSRPMEVWSVW